MYDVIGFIFISRIHPLSWRRVTDAADETTLNLLRLTTFAARCQFLVCFLVILHNLTNMSFLHWPEVLKYERCRQIQAALRCSELSRPHVDRNVGPFDDTSVRILNSAQKAFLFRCDAGIPGRFSWNLNLGSAGFLDKFLGVHLWEFLLSHTSKGIYVLVARSLASGIVFTSQRAMSSACCIYVLFKLWSASIVKTSAREGICHLMR